MSQALITIPLGIPEVRVLQTEVNAQGALSITVESTQSGTLCRRCGREIRKPHGRDEWVTVRHLSVLGRPTYLRYRPRRFRCPTCPGGPTTTERLAWHVPPSPHTVAYDEHLLLQVVHATVEDVSRKEGVAYDRVLGVLERRIQAEVDWAAYTGLDTLGLDEMALQKGQRDFVVIVTARLPEGRLVLLGVLPDRKKATVAAFLRAIPRPLRVTIQTVCCDMYEGYTEAVRKELPGAQLVIDRFHVAEKYHAAADTLRKQELKRLKGELPEEEYQLLKGHLWAFRKHPEDLKPEEQRILERLFSHAPQVKVAYDLRQELTAIFEQPLTRKAAKLKIHAWIKRVQKSGLTCFDTFLKTLTAWWDEITNYFVTRANSGFVEGFNNKLKVLKRRCYGLFNLKHLFQRIYLDLEGYRLFANPYMQANHGNSQ
jgi:transposase